MLAQLQNAIKELELQKQNLLDDIQAHGWKDNRHNTRKRIPEKRESALNADLYSLTQEKVTPARCLLSSSIHGLYQHWYSAVRTIIEKNQPSRIQEFEWAYSLSAKTSELGIKQLLAKRYVTQEEQFELMDLINAQYDMLAAVPSHLKFSLYDIELTAYSILMDDEITAAQYLLKNGFLRSAGALAGVVLERHLKTLLRKHTPLIKHKEKDSLSALNDLCKNAVYDLVTWRKVQHLADLRNLCDHDKVREPTKDEVAELNRGVGAMIKTQIENSRVIKQ